MASRAEQKAQARAARIELERQQAEAATRKMRLMRLAGVGIVAVIILVAAIVISSGNNPPPPVKKGSVRATATVSRVSSLLGGIPESGNNTLGNPSAPVQITEYGDLECSACDDFFDPNTIKTSSGITGSGIDDQIITNYVRTGKASLVYRSLDTATGSGATPSIFPTQQAAALAAGLQSKGWWYIELFYQEQQPEGTPYTQTWLDNIAQQIPGLNYAKWQSDLSGNSSLTGQVQSDQNSASQAGYSSTPTIVIKGPKGQAQAIQGVPGSFSQIANDIKSVS